MAENTLLLSVVVPVFNEAAVLESFHKDLIKVLDKIARDGYEIIYVNDGSSDNTGALVKGLAAENNNIKLVGLSRNFGKESALAAGIDQARGQATIMIDGDGQHPPELIPKFIESWQRGNKVVIGIRVSSKSDRAYKRMSSGLFYKIFNILSDSQIEPGSTDFRLIDKLVRQAFIDLGETDRITRGLIDWLGFKSDYIKFEARERREGSTGYSRGKLMNLATNSLVSFSPLPLYIFGYLGMFITGISLILGSAVLIEQIILGDPLNWNFTGTAMLSILLVFLVGLVLVSQGILSIYISRIHSQSKGRPLYVIDRQSSVGLKKV